MRTKQLISVDEMVFQETFGFGSTEKPETLDDLEANIERLIGDTNPQILEKVAENSVSRIRHVRANRGAQCFNGGQNSKKIKC